MKAFCLIISFILIPFFSFSQSDSSLIQFDDVTLSEALIKLKEVYPIDFSYSSDLVTMEKTKISGTFGSNSLQLTLKKILENTNIEYLIRDEIVILRRKIEPSERVIFGVVIDEENGLPVSYATVQVKGHMIGEVCDFRGSFKLKVSPRYQSDSIQVSSLGYQKRIFPITSEIPDTIYLNPSQLTLKPLHVTSTAYRERTLGVTSRKPKGELYMDTHGQQTALYFETGDAQGKIESVQYFLSEKGNTNAPFRIRIYEVDSLNHGPGEDLLKEFLVVQPDITGGWYDVNLLDYDLSLPDGGFFVAMEGVFPNDYEAYMTGDSSRQISRKRKVAIQQVLSYGQKLGYRKSKDYNTWHYSMSRTWFQLNQPFDVLINVDVLIEK